MKKCSTLCVRGIQNKITVKLFSSVHFSHSLVSDSLWPHLLHYARLPCPSATSRAWSNSRLSSRWYISTISSSVVPFCSHLQSYPASGPFPMRSLHQVAKVLQLQLQHQSFQWIFKDWIPLGLTGLVSLQSKGLSRVFSNTSVQKHLFFSAQLSL